MKEVDGIDSLKQILIIGKKIYEFEEKIHSMNIINDFTNFNFDFNIGKIVARLLKCPEEKNLEYIGVNAQDDIEIFCNDWIDDIIFDYYDNEITIDEAIKSLIRDD